MLLRRRSDSAPALVALLALALIGGCSSAPRAPDDWATWKATRMESVAGPEGWTTLIGLVWLKEGTQSAGAAPTNDAVLPSTRAAAFVGNFTRNGDAVRFDAAPGVAATVDGLPVRSVVLESDRDSNPTRLVLGPLTLVVIARGDRLGLRIRDPDSPARLHFGGLRQFPYDSRWRLQGRFEPFHEPRVLKVPSIIGGTQDYVSPGAVVFSHRGREFRLDVALEPGELDYFIMFRDTTSGTSTYPSGRFLYVAPADASGRVTLDFNRAYTPPCGFTSFATCPLPPPQNHLPLEIRAGERSPAGHPGG